MNELKRNTFLNNKNQRNKNFEEKRVKFLNPIVINNKNNKKEIRKRRRKRERIDWKETHGINFSWKRKVTKRTNKRYNVVALREYENRIITH